MANCGNAAGPPDGSVASVNPGGELIFDFGPGNGISDGPGADFVFFELPAAPGILLDFVVVEISTNGVVWYGTPVFAWEGTVGGVPGSNVAGYSDDSNPNDTCPGECDNEPIWSIDLYPGGLPLNTGVTVDIGPSGAPAGSYRYVRFTCPGSADAAEVDAIQRLN